MSLTSVDVRVLVHEAENLIVGAWITNIYQMSSNIFIFKLRKPELGQIFLLVEPGKRFHITKFNRKMPTEPPQLTKQLRSHLRDRRINELKQVEADRVIELNIGPDKGYRVVIELFGEGNLILISPNDKIVVALRYRKMRDRDIHPGRIFQHMPTQGRNILTNGIDEISHLYSTTGKVVIALNNWVGLGPFYSKYLLKEAKITKKKIEELTSQEQEYLTRAVYDLYARLTQNQYNPVVYLDTGVESDETNDVELDNESTSEQIEDTEVDFDDQWSDDELPFDPEQVIKILPWPQGEIENTNLVFVETLNLAYDVFYSSQEDHTELIGDAEQLETEADRLKNRLKQQLNHQKEMEKSAIEVKESANEIYENFTEIDELLTTVYNARKNNVSWEDITDKLQIAKDRNIPSVKLYERIEPSVGLIYVKLPKSKKVIGLDFRKQISKIANELYEKSKKQEHKAVGANKAIRLTEEKIKEAETTAESKRNDVQVEVTLLKRRKRWYEKWRWTISEDNTIIIAGLDAKTNEQLVRKYLDVDDFFIHPDLVGAPFVIIKSNGKTPSENTVNLAALLGVCFSSAWKSKRVVADAYMVEPEQVSLNAPSGEFMPQGSIMVYGEKHYIRNISLELYLGIIIEPNWARLMVGSLSTLQNHKCNHIVKLIPGDTPRGKVAKRVKEHFGRLVDKQDLRKIYTLDLSEFAHYIPGDSNIIFLEQK